VPSSVRVRSGAGQVAATCSGPGESEAGSGSGRRCQGWPSAGRGRPSRASEVGPRGGGDRRRHGRLEELPVVVVRGRPEKAAPTSGGKAAAVSRGRR
jgi:hypothetical protein